MKTCSIENCVRTFYARDYCRRHYERFRKFGDATMGATLYRDPEEALVDRSEPLLWSSCVVWTGPTTAEGYARFKVDRRMVFVHRYVWERENGPVPDGMHVDHTCWEPSCVNLDHLRLATPMQNAWNRNGARSGSGTGVRGVSRYDYGAGYVANVRCAGRRYYLGTFPTIEEASAVAQAKRVELFGEFAGAA